MTKGEEWNPGYWHMRLAAIQNFIGYQFSLDLKMYNYENNSPFLYPLVPAHSTAETHTITPRTAVQNCFTEKEHG